MNLIDIVEQQLDELLAEQDQVWLDAPPQVRVEVVDNISDTFAHQRYHAYNKAYQRKRDEDYLAMFGMPVPRPTLDESINTENEAERARLLDVAQKVSQGLGIPIEELLSEPHR